MVREELRGGVNLFVDYSQIVELECLRRRLCGTATSWGRIVTYQPDEGRV